MFTIKNSEKEIIDAAWSYFKSDQMGPKNFSDVSEVISCLKTSQPLKPLACWSNGKISSGTNLVEVWINPGDKVNVLPVKSLKEQLIIEKKTEEIID